MKQTLLFILQHIVDHPDDASVSEASQEGRTELVIHVHEEDMGKVIGKKGRVIRALRDIVKLMAAKENVYADVVIAESTNNESSTNKRI